MSTSQIEAPTRPVPDPPGLHRLSPRQLQVARLAAQGLSSEEMAEATGLKVNTVAQSLVAVYRETGVKNRVQAARWLPELLAEFDAQ